MRSVSSGSPPPRRLGSSVALDRVDVVVGDELARLAAERRVVGEEDPRLEPDGPRLAVRGDLGRAGRGAGHGLRRAAEVVPLVHAPRRSPSRRCSSSVSCHCCGSSVSMSLEASRSTFAGSAAAAAKLTHDEQRGDRPACRGVPPSVHPATPAPGTADASARARSCPQPASTSCPADWRSLVEDAALAAACAPSSPPASRPGAGTGGRRRRCRGSGSSPRTARRAARRCGPPRRRRR